MNLVTAVIVEGSFDQAKADVEATKALKIVKMRKIVPKLHALFTELDEDKNGSLSINEIANANEQLRGELMQFVPADSLAEVFDLLDVDGSGEAANEKNEIQSIAHVNYLF